MTGDDLGERGRAIFERLRDISDEPSSDDDAENSDVPATSTETFHVERDAAAELADREPTAPASAPPPDVERAETAAGISPVEPTAAFVGGDEPAANQETVPSLSTDSVEGTHLVAGGATIEATEAGLGMDSAAAEPPEALLHVEQKSPAEQPSGWPATKVPETVCNAEAVPPPLPPPAVPTGSEAVSPAVTSPARPATRATRPPPPDLPRVMAVANQKGGVGKTTTAVNLGAALAEMGYRVLVLDLDPQGNATTGLGINPRNLETSIYDVLLRDTPIEDCVEPTSVRNLFVCPATIDLAGAEIELVPVFSRELKLRRALEPVLDDFDFFLIDCPPSLGLITVNGLAAASEVIVPIQCEYYALEGLGQLLRNVNLVQANLNPRLEMSTIILTMYDARTKLSDQVASEVRSHFGTKVCRNIVPRTVRLSEAPSYGQPIIVFDPTSRGAIAYRELAKEVSGGAPQRVR